MDFAGDILFDNGTFKVITMDGTMILEYQILSFFIFSIVIYFINEYYHSKFAAEKAKYKNWRRALRVLRKACRRSLAEEENLVVNQEECSICKVMFLPGDDVITLPCCHEFHGSCIMKLFFEKRICPLCDQEAYETLGFVLSPEGEWILPENGEDVNCKKQDSKNVLSAIGNPCAWTNWCFTVEMCMILIIFAIVSLCILQYEFKIVDENVFSFLYLSIFE